MSIRQQVGLLPRTIRIVVLGDNRTGFPYGVSVSTGDDLHFCWDDRKAASNLKKHGVSFEAATYVFDDPMRLKTVSNAKAEARASADPDNRPMNEQQLNRMALAREVRVPPRSDLRPIRVPNVQVGLLLELPANM